MRRILSILIFLISINLSVFAQFENFKTLSKNSIPPQPKIKEWTIAVYINGRNNVDMFAYKDFNRIESVGSSEDVNLVAELGRAQGFMPDESTPEVWNGVRRFYITKDNDFNKISSPVIEDRKNADMGDWKEAADFLRWAKKNYPSKKIMFIIWDHGWGWIDPVKENTNLAGSKSISHDFVTGNYIKTTEIKKIFEKAGKVDIYASMACFMQMAEVVTEIRNYAKVVVGSEEVIQLPSFNWEDFLSLVLKYPRSNEEQLGIFLVDTFKEMYSRPEYFQLLIDGKYGTQLSAIRTSKIENFLSVIKEISDIMPKLKDKNAISKAKKEVLRFEVGELDTDPNKLISFYADPYHFFELIEQNYSDKSDPVYLDFKNKIYRFKNIINKEMIIKNVYLYKDRTEKDFSNAHGISMHIPGAKGHLIDYYQTYNELEFDKTTRWSNAIKFLEEID